MSSLSSHRDQKITSLSKPTTLGIDPSFIRAHMVDKSEFSVLRLFNALWRGSCLSCSPIMSSYDTCSNTSKERK